MGVKFLALLCSAGILLFVIELVRREKLTFKYAFAWLFLSALGVLCSLFPSWVIDLSKILGFEVPSNFVFFSLLAMFVLLSLMLTVFLCQQNRRNDRLAQALGLLEEEMRAVRQRDGERK